MQYESNQKHKEPWHHGKSGSLCPRWSWDIAREILDSSLLVGRVRFAVRDGIAFKGHEHRSGKWHGHPVGWNEVDQKIVNRWLKDKRVKRRDVRRHWTVDDVSRLARGDRE